MANAISESLNRMPSSMPEFKSKPQSVENPLERITHDAGEKVGMMTARLTDTATEYVKSGREYVRENPGKSVAVAAASGLVLGSLVTYVMCKRS